MSSLKLQDFITIRTDKVRPACVAWNFPASESHRLPVFVDYEPLFRWTSQDLGITSLELPDNYSYGCAPFDTLGNNALAVASCLDQIQFEAKCTDHNHNWGPCYCHCAPHNFIAFVGFTILKQLAPHLEELVVPANSFIGAIDQWTIQFPKLKRLILTKPESRVYFPMNQLKIQMPALSQLYVGDLVGKHQLTDWLPKLLRSIGPITSEPFKIILPGFSSVQKTCCSIDELILLCSGLYQGQYEALGGNKWLMRIDGQWSNGQEIDLSWVDSVQSIRQILQPNKWTTALIDCALPNQEDAIDIPSRSPIDSLDLDQLYKTVTPTDKIYSKGGTIETFTRICEQAWNESKMNQELDGPPDQQECEQAWNESKLNQELYGPPDQPESVNTQELVDQRDNQKQASIDSADDRMNEQMYQELTCPQDNHTVLANQTTIKLIDLASVVDSIQTSQFMLDSFAALRLQAKL